MKIRMRWKVFEIWHWSKLRLLPIILRQTRKILRKNHQNLFRKYLLCFDSYTDRLMLYIVFPILLERRREDRIKEKRIKKRRDVHGKICETCI